MQGISPDRQASRFEMKIHSIPVCPLLHRVKKHSDEGTAQVHLATILVCCYAMLTADPSAVTAVLVFFR